MDGFIDKFAQRKNAQEMIRANIAAEAEEKERMASRLSEYELAMQEMRRCNLQTMENAEKVKELLTVSLNKIEEVQKKDVGIDLKSEKLMEEIKDFSEDLKGRMAKLQEEQSDKTVRLLEEQKNQVTEFLNKQSELIERQNAQIQEMMETQKKAMEEMIHATEDFNHKEAVKVYRNVQAVIEGALPKQTEEITEAMKNTMEGKGISIGLKIVWAVTLIAALANVSIEVLKLLGYV